jgi:hypothetical protein
MMTERRVLSRLSWRGRNDEGFAMAVVISVILVMFIMLAAVTLPLSADIQSSIRLGKIADERQLAESVMNELFSQAAKSSDLNLGFRMIGRVDPGARSVDDAGDTAGWAKYVSGTGSFEACGAVTDLCFFYSPQLTGGSPFVTVEVTTRSSCQSTGNGCVFRRFQQTWRRRGFVDYVIFTDMETLQPELYGTGAGALVVRRGSDPAVTVDAGWAANHCGSRFVDGTTTLDPFTRGGLQDTSRRQTSNTGSVDYYLWPHRPGNDPSLPPDPAESGPQPSTRRHENCFDIAYTGTGVGDLDTITGPIHTNDYWFWYCGSPRFTDKVEATGDPYSGTTGLAKVFKPSTMSGCKALGNPQDGSGVTLTTAQAQIGPFLKLPDQLGNYDEIAGTQYTFEPTGQNKVRILLEPGRTMRVSTDGSDPSLQSPQPVPSRGVVLVKGRTLPADPLNVLEIQGEGSDATFVSEDNLTVTGDIIQPALTPGVTLGFVASGSITINQTPRTTAPAPRLDRYVSGAFLSLTGMSVQEWNNPADAAVPHPTLHLTGAIIAKYRPVFGTYDSTGKLQSGMRKDIRYPVDSKTDQIPPTPPYFVQPVNAVWVRLDFSETPLLAGAPGLTAAPTSPPQPPPSACPPSVTWPTGESNSYVPSCLLN